jgi:hypothetical protein
MPYIWQVYEPMCHMTWIHQTYDRSKLSRGSRCVLLLYFLSMDEDGMSNASICPTTLYWWQRQCYATSTIPCPPLPFRVEVAYTAQQKQAFEFGFTDGQGTADSCITLGGQPYLWDQHMDVEFQQAPASSRKAFGDKDPQTVTVQIWNMPGLLGDTEGLQGFCWRDMTRIRLVYAWHLYVIYISWLHQTFFGDYVMCQALEMICTCQLCVIIAVLPFC